MVYAAGARCAARAPSSPSIHHAVQPPRDPSKKKETNTVAAPHSMDLNALVREHLEYAHPDVLRDLQKTVVGRDRTPLDGPRAMRAEAGIC